MDACHPRRQQCHQFLLQKERKSPTLSAMACQNKMMRMIAGMFCWTVVRGFSSTIAITSNRAAFSSSTALDMARLRGLEKRRDGATPTEGGMTLYLKAAEDGTSVGDCPFAHAVRLVLEEKGLEYDVKPCTSETKPEWLIDLYEGKMPALRHRKECYVESSVIQEYLEFFFADPSLKAEDDDSVLAGFFPAVAQYLKDKEDTPEKLENLRAKLAGVNEHLDGKTYVAGDNFSLADCRLMPQLYHLQVGIEGFKNCVPSLETDYPNLHQYYQTHSTRPSFQATLYPKETVLWGWGNARN